MRTDMNEMTPLSKALFTTTFGHHNLPGLCLGLLLLCPVHLQLLNALEQPVVPSRLGKGNCHFLQLTLLATAQVAVP